MLFLDNSHNFQSVFAQSCYFDKFQTQFWPQNKDKKIRVILGLFWPPLFEIDPDDPEWPQNDPRLNQHPKICLKIDIRSEFSTQKFSAPQKCNILASPSVNKMTIFSSKMKLNFTICFFTIFSTLNTIFLFENWFCIKNVTFRDISYWCKFKNDKMIRELKSWN